MRLTHPTHPLRGQAFPIVQEQHKGNGHFLEIQLPDGERRLVPLDWTDQVPRPAKLPGARFLLANLLSLRQRLDALLPAATESSILPLENHEIEGGSDGNPEPGRLVQTDRGATHSDPLLAGPDVAPPSRGEAGG